MKKLWTLLFICLAFIAKGQDTIRTNEKGTTYLIAGYGLFVNKHVDDYNEFVLDKKFKGVKGPFYFKCHHAFTTKFSLGINLAFENEFEQTKYYDRLGYSIIHDLDYKSYSVWLRLNWHHHQAKKLYLFYGFGIGYRHGEFKDIRADISRNTEVVRTAKDVLFLGVEATVGIKYLITPHFGAYLEVGHAESAFQVGLVYQFFKIKEEEREKMIKEKMIKTVNE